MQKSPITTHILNLESGLPAAGVQVILSQSNGNVLSTSQTDQDGRIILWPDSLTLAEGTYQLRFEIEPWYQAQQKTSFYPYIDLVFKVSDLNQHYHVPLLLNAYGFSTYRGS